MKSRIKILHLEDSALDSELIHLFIDEGGIRHDYFLAENEEEFKQILKNEKHEYCYQTKSQCNKKLLHRFYLRYAEWLKNEEKNEDEHTEYKDTDNFIS